MENPFQELLKTYRMTDSKSTDKLLAIMTGMSEIDWDKVKEFDLTWQKVDYVVVPNVKITMKDGGE